MLSWRLLIDCQPDFNAVGEAGDAAETLVKAQELSPDLIFLNRNLSGLDRLAALPLLRKSNPECRILILTMHDDANHLQQALRAGAAGYVLKRAADAELLMAIRAVMRGETYVHSAMTGKLLQNVMPETAVANHENPWEILSERERDVLRLVALGNTNAEIAEALFLSVKTVETYRARGMEKLDLHTRAQLVKSALKHGLLDDSPRDT